MDTKVINLFAGPGAGKSTMAAGLFFKMKSADYKVELVTEYAKELVYDGAHRMLDCQMHVCNEQNKRQRRLVGKVDWIITDSPLLLATVHGKYDLDAVAFAYENFGLYDNINVFVNRVKPYRTYGRRNSEASARAVDDKLRKVLPAGLINLEVTGDEAGLNKLYKFIKDTDVQAR